MTRPSGCSEHIQVAALILVIIVVFVLSQDNTLYINSSEMVLGIDYREQNHTGSGDLAEVEALVSNNVASRTLFSLSNFNDPSSIKQKKSIANHYDGPRSDFVSTASQDQRSPCQIIYILGAEVGYFI